MAEPRKLRVFLCHASQDKPVVRDLYQRILAEGWIDPWLDEEKLLPGQDWDLEIEKAVEAADVVIVCLSNRSVTKEGYIQRELRFAIDIALQKPEGTIFIIPLKLEDCEPPRKLRTWQYVEYFPSDKREKSFRLVMTSMQERSRALNLFFTANGQEIPVSTESLSSKIISKKISDARHALQNDQLPTALEIYDALIKQKLRLNEIINDLEDVSIVYSDSRTLWAALANAHRMNGNINRAQEYEQKIKNHQTTNYGNGIREPQTKFYEKEGKHSLDNHLEDEKQPTSFASSLPSTISIETLGGVSTPIFYKGDSLPAEFRNTFSTATDNQSQVEVRLVLGENKLASDNESLGKFVLDGILPAPKGVPQIDILVKISRELELNILATEKATGRTKNLQLARLDTIAPPPIKDPLPPKNDSSSTENLFGSSDFSDFFQTIFGNTGTANPVRSKSYQPSMGHQQLLEINIEEAYTGKTHFIKINGVPKQLLIPAGVQAGSKIRVAGAGPNGLDLYFTISIQPHRFFAQSGSDLFMHYPVSETFAYHGGEIRVPLLEKNKSILVTIPPNTKDKQIFRFANKGFPKIKKPTEFGDFYLTVDLYDPRNIPQEFKELLNAINSYVQ